jgi:hypothetical protein
MTKREIIIILAIFMVLISTSFVTQSQQGHNNVTELKIVDKDQFLEKIIEKQLPIVDSTNFDNFQIKDTLDSGQVKYLHLKYLPFSENASFSLNYKLNISTDFKTYVFSYYPNEQEIYTILVNYSNTYEFIDYKVIAYDEIAESFIKIFSTIYKEKIISVERNFSSGKTELTRTEFKFLRNGKIK